MKKILTLIALGAVFVTTSCSKKDSGGGDTQPPQPTGDISLNPSSITYDGFTQTNGTVQVTCTGQNAKSSATLNGEPITLPYTFTTPQLTGPATYTLRGSNSQGKTFEVTKTIQVSITSNTRMLTAANGWALFGEKIKDVGSTQYVDINLSQCWLDNTDYFFLNGKCGVAYGTNHCGPGEEDNTNAGNWTFSLNAGQLILNWGQTKKVNVLNDSIMELQYLDPFGNDYIRTYRRR